MKHRNQIDTERNATRQPRKGKMSMRDAVQPYLERLAALNAQREADRINASVNWGGTDKK